MVRVRPHIGARCRVGRDGCLIAPPQRYESQFPNQFERYLQTWEAASSLLLESPQSNQEDSDVRVENVAVRL